MLAQELMTRNVEYTSPEAVLQVAALKMKELDVGVLPVCDEGRLVGMITDRDITLRSVSDGRDPRTDRVRDAMTADVIFCFANQDVSVVAELMRDKQVRRLPVLDEDNRLVGILSLGDLAQQGGNEQLSGRVLEGISEPISPLV
jgi:CBS domain-containing protein